MAPPHFLHVLLARLRTASPPEIIHRIRSLMVWERLKWRYRLGRRGLRAPEVRPAHLKGIRLPALEGAIGPETVDRLLSGETFPLPHPAYFQDSPGKQPAPDIRALWEPARLQHIAVLLEAASRPEFRDRATLMQAAAQEGLLGWLREEPFPFGIQYACAMECAFRTTVPYGL